MLKKLAGNAIQHYIQQQTTQLIPTVDQQAFINTVNEDLQALSPSRIAGLGVSIEQLQAWQNLQ